MTGKLKAYAQQRVHTLAQELYAQGLPWSEAMLMAERQVYGDWLTSAKQKDPAP
jgi:hypothetical protein